MDIIEEIAEHLYEVKRNGTEDDNRWFIKNEFRERQDSEPSEEDIKAVITRLKELIEKKSE